MAIDIESLKRSLEQREASAATLIAKFAASLIEDPQSALEWSQREFAVAAKHRIARVLLRAIAKGKTIEEMHANALSEALSGASFQESSTSQASNNANRCLLAAWADAEEMLRGFMKG